jgi:hypothetical protein
VRDNEVTGGREGIERILLRSGEPSQPLDRYGFSVIILQARSGLEFNNDLPEYSGGSGRED